MLKFGKTADERVSGSFEIASGKQADRDSRTAQVKNGKKNKPITNKPITNKPLK